MSRHFLVALAMYSACSGGCATERPVWPIAAYHPGQATKCVKVRYPADYSLVQIDDPSCSGVPVSIHTLRRGDTVGFERDPDGVLVAVVPGIRHRLAEAEYAWRVSPASPQHWNERLADKTEAVARTTKNILVWTALILLVVGLLAWYVLAVGQVGF